ncbi:MAG TPA: asparagine synthase (glutamine-hydrolyzing) [Puia sp.]|nr:asparagine synthase (glutamine-hydrolyzing) [Puia sp.]
MCGIAGILSPDPARVTIRRLKNMTDALAHRGPDGEGHWIDGAGGSELPGPEPSCAVGLGHRRLSVIDLSPAGAQPMTCLDRYSIIHNGEIYNYIELREVLQSKGYAFHTRTDTEVIAAAYDCFGPDCLRHFDGMFAFALWDSAERRLFLARDRFGEKPLFIFQDETQFLFASEMKALWAAGVPKTLNPPMLFNFITLGYTQNPANPAETFYKDITRLPARSYLCYHAATGKREIQPYWDPPGDTGEPHHGRPEKDIVEEFDSLMAESVRRRLRSDVSIGASLSGGLDSSAIVSYILEQPDRPASLPTFSAVFPGFEKDETSFIRQVTRHFNLTNFSTTPTAADLLQDLDRLAAQQEEPFQSASIYAQYRVYALAKTTGITVLLDGQGADELLAGYPKYFAWYWRELYRNDPRTLATELAAVRDPAARQDWSWKQRLAATWPELAGFMRRRSRIARQRGNKDLAKDFVHAAGISYYDLPPVNRLNNALYYNALTNGLEELLRYADRNSMAHGVETRLPFLDHRLAEFLFALPAHFKIRDGWTKWLLRINREWALPAGIVWRKDKTGFEPPQQQWMTDPAIIDRIAQARKSLIGKGILDHRVLQKKIQPMGAHSAENYDWRYLVTAACLG